MEVILLGTSGGGLVSKDRNLMSQIVFVGDEPLLFDCGGGITRQMIKEGIPPNSIHHLFFTHHHLDHNSDYVYFMFTSWLDGRSEKLNVFGPPETERITRSLFGRDGVFRQDLTARIGLLGSVEID